MVTALRGAEDYGGLVQAARDAAIPSGSVDARAHSLQDWTPHTAVMAVPA